MNISAIDGGEHEQAGRLGGARRPFGGTLWQQWCRGAVTVAWAVKASRNGRIIAPEVSKVSTPPTRYHGQSFAPAPIQCIIESGIISLRATQHSQLYHTEGSLVQQTGLALRVENLVNPPHEHDEMSRNRNANTTRGTPPTQQRDYFSTAQGAKG